MDRCGSRQGRYDVPCCTARSIQENRVAHHQRRRSLMPGQSTLATPQQLITAAKAPTLAYNDKNWAAVRAAVTGDFTYDEVATQRKVQGADQAIALFQGWAAAFPDSRGTFHSAI